MVTTHQSASRWSTSPAEEVILRRYTDDSESQGPEQMSTNPTETAEPESANTSFSPISERQENAGANSTGQGAPQVEPEQKRYPSRACQPTPRYM